MTPEELRKLVEEIQNGSSAMYARLPPVRPIGILKRD